MLHDIDFWRSAALIVAALGQTVFVLLYATFPWYKSFLGRSLFGKAIVLMTILDVYALSRVFDFGHEDMLFTGLYVALALGVWWQFTSFLRIRLAGLHEDHSGRVSGNRVNLDG